MAESTTTDYRDLYTILLMGKRVRKAFSSYQEYLSFRNRLASMKSREDKVLHSIGDDGGSLHAEWVSKESKNFVVIFYVTEERAKTLITYEILDDDEDTEEGKENLDANDNDNSNNSNSNDK